MSLILSGTDGLSDVDGTAATPAIRGTDANTGIFFGADIIGFSEGGVEAARINADSQFVAAAGTAALPVITTTGDLNTGIFFPAADTIAFSEGGTECARFDSSGNLKTIATISVGNATPSTSGAGITFPATQSASTNANTLDDYEEGTWTPTDGSGAGLTFTGASGTYVKIGSLCYITGILTFPSTASGASAKIGSLPFSPNSATVYNNYGPPIRNNKSLSMQIFGVEDTGFLLLPIGDYTTYVLNSAMTSGTMLFSFTYRTE